MTKTRFEKSRIAQEAIDRQLGENSRTWQQRPMMGDLDESGLSRVWSLTKAPFAIVTAFKGPNDRQTNLNLNRALLGSLNAARMGPHLLIGHYQETLDGYKLDLRGGQRVVTTPDGEIVPYANAVERGMFRDGDGIEDSFFVPMPKSMDVETFTATMVTIARQYSQNSVLFGDGRDVGYLYPSGAFEKLWSKPTFNKIGVAYSQLRGRPNVPFIFEGTGEPFNVSSLTAFRETGLRYSYWDRVLFHQKFKNFIQG